MDDSSLNSCSAFPYTGFPTIKMTDIDLMTAIGYAMGAGALLGILFSLLLFFWRRETM